MSLLPTFDPVHSKIIEALHIFEDFCPWIIVPDVLIFLLAASHLSNRQKMSWLFNGSPICQANQCPPIFSITYIRFLPLFIVSERYKTIEWRCISIIDLLFSYLLIEISIATSKLWSVTGIETYSVAASPLYKELRLRSIEAEAVDVPPQKNVQGV